MPDMPGGVGDVGKRLHADPRGNEESFDLQGKVKEGMRNEAPLDKIRARMDEAPPEEEVPEEGPFGSVR